MSSRRLLSVALPTYEMGGLGHIFLKESLDKLAWQSFKDFEVVVSDYSKNNLIKNLCRDYEKILDIKYLKNTDPAEGMSANVNNAIRNSTGKIIKILLQDDFLYDKNSLKTTVDNFDLNKDFWLVTGCEHTEDGDTFIRPFYPKYNHRIHLGKNTIGSPSVLTIKNDQPLLFDKNLTWLVDCDYYKQCYQDFGSPKVVNSITVVIRIGKHQITQTLATQKLREKEFKYEVKKFGKINLFNEYLNSKNRNLKLPQVTLVAVSSINIASTIKALSRSMVGIDYGQVLLVTNQKPDYLPKGIDFKKGPRFKSVNDYSKFMVYDLTRYIKTEYALVVQYDGYVVRPDRWNNKFFEFDYIGAPWPKNLHFTNEGTNVRVGNGGFSLRSQKLMNALNDLKLPFTDNGTGYWNEDGILCVYYRRRLEEYGIRYAPASVAAQFSHESDCAESVSEPFGFHKNTKVLPRLFFMKHRFREMLRIYDHN